MIEVVATDEFVGWYQGLSEQDAIAVTIGVDRLEQQGIALGHPYSSAIKSAKEPIRELRIQSGGRPLRVFYAFDPVRQAVLLIGGDKTGDARFYDTYVPRAEAIWRQYLAELEAERKKRRK